MISILINNPLPCNFFSNNLIDKKLSFIPVFKNIINWPSDIRYFIINYIPFFLFWIFIILLLYFIYKKIIKSLIKDNKNEIVNNGILNNILLWINENLKQE